MWSLCPIKPPSCYTLTAETGEEDLETGGMEWSDAFTSYMEKIKNCLIFFKDVFHHLCS